MDSATTATALELFEGIEEAAEAAEENVKFALPTLAW